MKSKKDIIRETAEGGKKAKDARFYQRHKKRLREKQSLYYQKTSLARIAKSKEYRNSPEGRSREMVKAARARAKQKNINFTISYLDLLPILVNGRCEITDIPFQYVSYSPFAPSLDRKVPEIGYTPENTQIVVKAYNYAKGCGTHEDVLRLARSLVKN